VKVNGAICDACGNEIGPNELETLDPIVVEKSPRSRSADHRRRIHKTITIGAMRAEPDVCAGCRMVLDLEDEKTFAEAIRAIFKAARKAMA
jgi:hypothetical protein